MSKRKASYLPNVPDNTLRDVLGVPRKKVEEPRPPLSVPGDLRGSFDLCGGCGDYLPSGVCDRCMPKPSDVFGVNVPSVPVLEAAEADPWRG